MSEKPLVRDGDYSAMWNLPQWRLVNTGAFHRTNVLSHRTAKAIAWLRANYTKPLRVEELAEVARMGMSTLHHHFRALTAMSPLQYQKQLRLVAARERMLVEGIDAASAAFEVGYESASQPITVQTISLYEVSL
jgi:AraC-like DNA-binding protein